MKSVIQMVKDFFGDVQPLGLDELKRLSSNERQELADAIATQQGMVKVDSAGKVEYRKAA